MNKSTITQRLAESTKIILVGLILGSFSTKKTFAAIYYSEELDEESKMTILTRRNVILNLVREQIDKEATV